MKEILNFGKEKEENRLTRVERERLYQEKLKAEEEAAKKLQQEEIDKKTAEAEAKVTSPLASSSCNYSDILLARAIGS